MGPTTPRALLLHGLFRGQEEASFEIFQGITDYLTSIGMEIDCFYWGPTIEEWVDVLRALKSRDDSFFETMAKALEAYLEKLFSIHGVDTRWIVVAHSAGGGIWYRWLKDCAQEFFDKYGMSPECVIAIASPYNWDRKKMEGRGQRISFGAGAEITIRAEWPIEAEIIVSKSPGKLLVILAENDITTPVQMTGFDDRWVQSGDVEQPVPIMGTDHNTVCTSGETLAHIKRVLVEEGFVSQPADSSPVS